MSASASTTAEMRRHLRELARAVLRLRTCAARPDGGCMLLSPDGHLDAAYRRAEQAEAFLRGIERAPS